MKFVVAWLKSKNINSHVVAALLVSAAGLIAFDTQVQQFIESICGAHVKLAAEIIAAAVIVAKYSHSSSPAGTVASAVQVQASAEPQTKSEVAAATVPPKAN